MISPLIRHSYNDNSNYNNCDVCVTTTVKLNAFFNYFLKRHLVNNNNAFSSPDFTTSFESNPGFATDY